jgi:cyclopropane fatty-acyl-phospholipid synthase-like methyltransferase
MIIQNHFIQPFYNNYAFNVDTFIKNNNNNNKDSMKQLFGNNLNQRIPISTLFESYFNEEIDFKKDLLLTLEQRNDFINYIFTFDHIKFFIFNLLPELLIHSLSQDRAQVSDHYNRGNNFFHSFLGDSMVYTSAVFKYPIYNISDHNEKSIYDSANNNHNNKETLEEAQQRKLGLICKKLHLKENDEYFDFGCGWGSLILHASKYYHVNATGITLAKEQIKFGEERSRLMGIEDKVKFLCCDWRDINIHSSNNKQYDAISSVEMAEHVGIRHFNDYLNIVYNMLKNDGIFYLQMAGLRRSWKYEDLIWGLFMNKYVFPGADASTPIYWVISKLEEVGFEIHSLENVGVHYSQTIYYWYLNWKSNEKYIKLNYGERWYRIWYFFLAWSVLISKVGRSSCYQIICHKNLSEYNRSKLIGEQFQFWNDDNHHFYKFNTPKF